MASVFLSYDHEDEERAKPIVIALENAGHSVWWDQHIHGGAEYNSAIERAVESADVVVVLWSERSVRSTWVRDEAAEGRDRGKLVPATLDGTKPPMGFRQFQTIDLAGWKGRKRIRKLEQLLDAVVKVAGVPSRPVNAPRTSTSSRNRLVVAASAVLLIVVGMTGYFQWRPFGSETSTALVAVSPADSSAASQSLARDLFAQLGEIPPAQEHGLRLVDADRRNRANLLFRVTGSTEDRVRRASLVLLNPKTETLLWSRDFQRAAERGGDLREELGYTAALVLRCALEAHAGGPAALNSEILKLYLKGCAEQEDADYEAALALVPLFREVVDAVPSFEAGWSRLLTLEAGLPEFASNGALLKRDIANARKVNPRLAAAYAVEMGLLPDGAWAQKLAIADRGIAANPDDSWLRVGRAEVLFAVGRRGESVDDFRHAMRSDPLSPRMRSEYARWLGLAGQMDAAVLELREIERIWPDSTSLAAVKFGFHLRYGDPRVALQIIRSGKMASYFGRWESYLHARMNPTPANVSRAVNDARLFYERDPGDLQHYVQALSIFNRENDLLLLLISVPVDQARSVTDATFRPAARELWRDPRSLVFAKRVGLLQYWQSSRKWPDFCGDTDLPYDCKKEAAKITD